MKHVTVISQERPAKAQDAMDFWDYFALGKASGQTYLAWAGEWISAAVDWATWYVNILAKI